MVGTLDNAAGVETVQPLEAAFRKVKLKFRVQVSRLLDAGNELVVRVAHEDAGKTRREREDIVTTITTEDDIRFIGTKFVSDIFERSLFGSALREKVEKALAGLGVEAVNDDLVELAFDQFLDCLQNGLFPVMVNVLALLERAAMLALLLCQAVHPGDGSADRFRIPPGAGLLHVGIPAGVGLPAILLVLSNRRADVTDEHMRMPDAVLLNRIFSQIQVPSGHVDDEYVMLFREFIEQVDGVGVRRPATVRE